jgi:ATP-binding cassette subfamily B protein
MSEITSNQSPIAVIGRGVRVEPSFRQGFGLTLVLALIGTGARVAIPISLQQTIDRGLLGDSVDLRFIVNVGLATALFIAIASFALRTAAARLGSRAEHGLYSLRVRLFGHIHRLSIEDHHDTKKGELVSRVTSDVESMTQFFAWGGLTLLLDGAQIAVVTLVMVAYDWRLALVAVVVSAPLGFVLRLLQGRLLRAHTRSRERNAKYLAEVGESISGIATLRAYRALQPQEDRLIEASRQRSQANIRAGVLGALLFPLGEVFAVATVCAVVGAGLLIGPDGGLTAGALVGFVFLTYRLLEPIAEFTEVMDMTQSAVANLRRVLGVLEIPSGPPESQDPFPLPPGRLDVRLDRVSFVYDADDPESARQALVGVSLHVGAGESVALVGSSGSGKSTVGRLVARLIDPTLGAVEIGGVDLRRVANEDLRRRVVIVPQEPFLFSTTIEENLSFSAPDATTDQMLEACRRLGLSEWLEALPLGLQTQVGQRGAGLSAGERQLVALVRAEMSDPDVLILDEATSSVDPQTEARMARALDVLSHGRTTISVAHRLSTAIRADRVIVMVEGRVVGSGSHTQLLTTSTEYAKLYGAWLSSATVE